MNFAPTAGIRPKLTRAFSIVETIAALAVVSMSALALIAGIVWGTTGVGFIRDNQQATQILTERMETIRLYSFDQITNSAFLPRTSQITEYQKNNATGKVYTLTVSVTNRFLTANYSNDVALVSLDLRWQSGNVQRQRSLSTYVYRDGLQTFINP